jgi:hypothetical protein
VRLIQVEVRLVLFLDGYNLSEAAHLALHAINALNHYEDLIPRPVRPWLPLRNGGTQDTLQMFWLVVAEHFHPGGTAAHAVHNTAMVQRIGHHQCAFAAHQYGQSQAVGREAHAEDKRSGLAHEGCHFSLKLHVHRRLS